MTQKKPEILKNDAETAVDAMQFLKEKKSLFENYPNDYENIKNTVDLVIDAYITELERSR